MTVEDLQYLTREEVLVRLATRIEKAKGRIQVIEIVTEIAKGDNKLKSTMPPEIVRALDNLKALDEELLELRSILHWLTLRRP